MPRVDWPKKRPRQKYPVIFSILIAVLVVSSVVQLFQLTKPQTALAATQELPVPGLSSDPMSLVITQSTSGALINAQDDYIKIYIDPNAVGNDFVNIWNAGFDPCGSANHAQPDWTKPADPCFGRPVTANMEIDYDFYAMDANENPANNVLMFALNGATGAMTTGGTVAVPQNNWSGNIPINTALTHISTLTDYRVVIVKAHFTTAEPVDTPGTFTPELSRLHSYRIRTVSNADQLGFWAAEPGSPPADGQYVTHFLNPGVLDRDVSEEFDFAPSCAMSTDQSATLKWYDIDDSLEGGGDGTHGFWDLPPWFEFFQYDANGVLQSQQRIDGRSAPTIGGNNDYREFNYTAHPGWKYRWVWHNINGNYANPSGTIGTANNIQMWLPFDSINYNLSCFDYHSTLNAAAGTVPGGPSAAAPATLDFSNPANYTNMTFNVNIRNDLNGTGPPVFVNPTMVVSAGATNCTTGISDTWGPPLTNQIHGPLTGNQVVNNAGQFSCSLNPNTPTGTIVCFGDHITPNVQAGDGGIDNDPPDQCYTVQNSRRFPAVVGQNSDIHAGGGLCNQAVAPAPYFIKGNVSATGTDGDYGDYVVSSAGLISDFQSNGVAGTNQLTMGANGSYATICRPDLYAFATNNPSGVTVPGGTYNIGTDPNFTGNAVFINGNATIDGALNHRLTIVASGDITIDKNITVGGAAGPRSTVASLGVIAHGNINIDSAATRVDAYLFSDQSINTCDTGLAAPVPPQCDSMLVVNGFLMANALSLQRLGPLGSVSTGGGPTTGEDVILNPELYLNPPPYFDSSVDNATLQGLGERQPLF